MLTFDNLKNDDPVLLTVDIPRLTPLVVPGYEPKRNGLYARHRNELRASGISDELIKASGIRSVSGAEAKQMLNWTKDGDGDAVGPGWAIPFDDPNAPHDPMAPECYWRVKFDEPRQRDGRTIKYESPVGGSNRVYFPPGFDRSDGATLIITEGEKKSLSAMTYGSNCLGLTGCWNWQKSRKRDDTGRAYGSRHLIDDLARLKWADRAVVICFDSDAAEKHTVELAQQRLAEALAKRGAHVRIARLPGGAGGHKLGLDDAFVELGVTAVRDILDAAEPPELPKSGWPELARVLLEDEFAFGAERTLRFWRDVFWHWTGRCYEEVRAADIRNRSYRFLERISGEPTRNKAEELVTALKAEVEVPGHAEPPCYLGSGYVDWMGTPLVFADRIALVDFDRCTGTEPLVSQIATPAWFCTAARAFAYDEAAECPVWEEFLAASLPDPDARRLLQQWAGYLIAGRRDRHKLMILHGAMRAGKSIIANTLAQLVGETATATSTLKNLAEDFGLWSLLGKQLLLIPDAHDRGECLAAVERLKAITGCDGLDINRKYLEPLNNVHLSTRVVITCNQLPRFLDASGALYRRLLLINFEHSFAGREDRSLPGRIHEELPGVFNWAMRGWVDLRGADQFVAPPSSQVVLEEAAHVFSPIADFIDECCELDAARQVSSDMLWTAWRCWCQRNNYQPGGRNKLGVDLRGYLPGVQRLQLRTDSRRVRAYQGLGLNPHGQSLCEAWLRTEYRRA